MMYRVALRSKLKAALLNASCNKFSF